jgi:hypothetical protein
MITYEDFEVMEEHLKRLLEDWHADCKSNTFLRARMMYRDHNDADSFQRFCWNFLYPHLLKNEGVIFSTLRGFFSVSLIRYRHLRAFKKRKDLPKNLIIWWKDCDGGQWRGEPPSLK